MAADEERLIVALRRENDSKGDLTDDVYDWGGSDHVTLDRLINNNIPKGYMVLGFWWWNRWSNDFLSKNTSSHRWIIDKVAEMRARGIVHMRGMLGEPAPKGRKPRIELVQDWLENQDHDELVQRAWEAVQACSKGGSL